MSTIFPLPYALCRHCKNTAIDFSRMHYFWWLLHLLVWGSNLQTIQAIPPKPPVQCNRTVCTLYNAFGPWLDRKDCNVKSVVYPTTEEELRLAVAYANKNRFKVKVVTKFSHTIPKLACPSTHLFDDSMLISTENMIRVSKSTPPISL